MDLEETIDSRIQSYKTKLKNLKDYRAEVTGTVDDYSEEALDNRIKDFAEFIRMLKMIQTAHYRERKNI